MKILILGGTRFLGIHLVGQALNRGHEVSVFTRGKSAVTLPPQVVHLIGDRDGHLETLMNGNWDWVIDTSGYVPRVVRQSAELLQSRVKHYLFVSSISVYKELPTPHMDETAPLAELVDPDNEDISANYGALKAACERVIQDLYLDRALIIRPGLIVGDHDPTDRFTYWVWRTAQGGTILSPGNPEIYTQFIDVKDLAMWMIMMIENGAQGIYNATGGADSVTLGDVLDACLHITRSHAHFKWVPEAFLQAQNVKAWSDIPLWIPTTLETHRGFLRVSCNRAQVAGLTYRPLGATVRDVLAMLENMPKGSTLKAGLSLERESQLLMLMT
jgi:2'-hydroxyisoflavone reductase